MAWRRQEPRTHRSRNELDAPNAAEYLQRTVHQCDLLVMPLHLSTSESPPDGRPSFGAAPNMCVWTERDDSRVDGRGVGSTRALDFPAALGESNGPSRFQNCPIRPAPNGQ
jgi:hypothetical protein